ncbi:MAG TPA: hypothetical protein VNH11_18355 [Pirellulales bacterium]|nr:hypothetical protein [Pirellulales bacterium]
MHDPRFKKLLKEFFAEFFWLFFPTWAARFDFGSGKSSRKCSVTIQIQECKRWNWVYWTTSSSAAWREASWKDSAN